MFERTDKRVTLKCAFCGKEFERLKCNVRSEISYCSRKCKDAARKKHHPESKPHICNTCSKPLDEYNYYVGFQGKKYCNRECATKKRPMLTLKCDFCEKEFQRVQSQVRPGGKYYCSIRCQNRARARDR